jgi:hypothetical protein
MGWDTLLNGDLLKATKQVGFECLLTGDRNLAYQQNLTSRKIAIVELNSNRLKLIKEQISIVSDALNQIKFGEYCRFILERPALRRRKFIGKHK